jgi:uncharacterized membrane protein YhiD involved in acid resistance
MIKNLIANWKTTSAGLTMIVGAVVHMIYALRAHGLTEADCSGSLIAIIGGIGFIAAGDANVNPPTQPKQ